MDATDRDIVEALLTREQTAHELSKTLFKTEDQWELRKHYSFLRYRLGRLAEDGLVRRREGRRAVYYIPLEEMVYGKARLLIDNGSSIIELEMGKVLVTEKDGEIQTVLLLQK